MTGLIFTLLWFPLIGLAVSRLAGRMNLFLAGAGANGLILFLASVLHLPLIPTLIAIGLASVAIVVFKRGGASPSRVPRQPLAADIAMWIAVVWLFVISAILPLTDYDGRAFWLLK